MANLIAFVGAMGSGKTTAAQYLVDKHNFVRVAFADALKEKAVRITPDGKIDKLRDRKLLQFLGTEYFRETIDPNYWIDLYRDYVQGQLSRAHSIVTDDCRFPNEVDTVIALGGYPVYVSAKEEDRASRLTVRDGKYTPGIQGHKSEDVFTLRFKCRSLIINDGTLEELYAQLDKVYTSVRATSGASPTL